MSNTNFMDAENIHHLLSNIDPYDVKYWYENNAYEGEQFETLLDHLFEINEDEVVWIVADYFSEQFTEEEFVEVVADEDWDIELPPLMMCKHDVEENDLDAYFVNCTIKWKGDDKTEDVTIAVAYSKEELENEDHFYTDEDVVFYAIDNEDLYRLFNEDNGEDFVIVKYDSYDEE